MRRCAISETMFLPFFRTWYLRFGRLKEAEKMIGLRKRSCFMMSSDTRGVAVAVSAMMGTWGNSFLRNPSLLHTHKRCVRSPALPLPGINPCLRKTRHRHCFSNGIRCTGPFATATHPLQGKPANKHSRVRRKCCRSLKSCADSYGTAVNVWHNMNCSRRRTAACQPGGCGGARVVPTEVMPPLAHTVALVHHHS